MRQRGLWGEAADRLRIQREGGYTGIDALMSFIYYFAAGLDVGVKEFSDRAREHHGQLAAVGQRCRLPTQSSMSRILAAVEAERAREFGSWLLLEAPDVAAVLQHPSVLTRDAVGEGWHIFDWDPTVTTLRQRALPVFDGMPNGRRRSELLAEPGYPGRKRGDVQFSRATLQHAGSGLWLGIEMAPGNGALRDAFQSAVRQVVATCEHAELSLDRAVLRADGAAGNVPFITACTEAGVHYLTRLAHYQLLEDKSIVEHLNDATWCTVPSSGSGPTRQAADLGQVVLEAAPTTLRADGRVFEPVETRVVVSRFPSSENGRGAGVVLDDWQYELYASDLPPTAWPETEIVSGYYGRNGQENRFCQEDRELHLDRIFSYHLPGQQLATLIGLFVWNFEICRGMELASPPEALPPQEAAHRMPATETPRLPDPTEPAAADDAVPTTNAEGTSSAGAAATTVAAAHAPPTTNAEESSAAGTAATAVALAHALPTTNAEESSAANAAPEPRPDAGSLSSADSSDSPGSTRRDVIEALDALDWTNILGEHDGWMWLGHKGGLQCPSTALLPLLRVEQIKGELIRARFQADSGTCDSCEHRPSCIRSGNPHYRKDVRLSIPSPHAEPLRAMWSSLCRAERNRTSASKRRLSARRRRRPPRPNRRLKSLSWRPPDLLPHDPPKLAVAPPFLLPAQLRKVSRGVTRPIVADVHLDLPPRRPKPSPVLALSVADRQKRRLTWDERLRWNELPEGACIEIRLFGSRDIRQLLPTTTEHPAKRPKSA